MALRDLLAEETNDAATAAAAAARGQSLTGFSGRHTEVSREALFGERVQQPTGGFAVESPAAGPIAGERMRGGDAFLAAGLADTPERKPFGENEQTLAYPPRPGYRRYWFSDIPGRVIRAKEAGYSHVVDPTNGNPLSRITDRADGRGRSSYLMETPEKWYQEDMARNAERLAARLNDIRHGRAGPGAEDNRYIPHQGISIQGR